MTLFKKKVKDDFVDEVKKQTLLDKFKGNRKAQIGAGVVVLLILVLVLKAVSGGSSKKLNFYDTVDNIFSSELGSFKYVLDVRTGEKGSLIKANTVNKSNLEDLKNVKSASGDAQEPTEKEDTNIADQSNDEAKKNKNEFQDWTKYAEIKGGDWQYPNYKLIIEGCTTELKPLKTDFTISLATESYNSNLTRVICADGNYYIDIESLYNWLKSSGDSYLVELGSKLPNGSKWLVIPEEEFKVPSRYAEDGEKEFSETKGLVNLYRRFLVAMKSTKSVLQNNLGTTGMTSDKETASINLQNKDAEGIITSLKDITTKSGDFYSTLVSAGVEQKLYDDAQKKQALREKDNFVAAMNDLAMYLNIVNPSDLGLKVSGNCRSYVNGKGNQTLEATLAFQYCSQNTDHVVQFKGYRSGDKADIVSPSGSQTRNIDSVFLNTAYSMCDYFNTTLIKPEVKLETTPSAISDEVLTRFAKLVNEMGTSDTYLTKHNVSDFIQKYSKMSITPETSKEDIANIKLVQDLTSSLGSILGTSPIKEGTESGENVERFPSVEASLSKGVSAKFTYSEKDSDSKLMVVDVKVQNKSKDDFKLDLTTLSARTLLNSTYPANNDTLLFDYDNAFDVDNLAKVLNVKAGKTSSARLYFVLADDTGHLDLYYGNTKLDSIVQY